MKWFIFGLILGWVNWIIIRKFAKIRIRRFEPIRHHGGVSHLNTFPGLSPFCDHCTYKIEGFGVQIEQHIYYHISCWLKQLLPQDRK